MSTQHKITPLCALLFPINKYLIWQGTSYLSIRLLEHIHPPTCFAKSHTSDHFKLSALMTHMLSLSTHNAHKSLDFILVRKKYKLFDIALHPCALHILSNFYKWSVWILDLDTYILRMDYEYCACLSSFLGLRQIHK